MAKRRARRVHRELTPKERQRWREGIKEIESQKEEILARGRRIKAARERANHAVREAMLAP